MACRGSGVRVPLAPPNGLSHGRRNPDPRKRVRVFRCPGGFVVPGVVVGRGSRRGLRVRGVDAPHAGYTYVPKRHGSGSWACVSHHRCIPWPFSRSTRGNCVRAVVTSWARRYAPLYAGGGPSSGPRNATREHHVNGFPRPSHLSRFPSDDRFRGRRSTAGGPPERPVPGRRGLSVPDLRCNATVLAKVAGRTGMPVVATASVRD